MLGQQTKLKFVYANALTAAKKTAGVTGRMTVKDAVARLLAQTGLSFTVTSMGAVQISPLSARDKAFRAQAAIPLDTINVEGGNTAAIQCEMKRCRNRVRNRTRQGRGPGRRIAATRRSPPLTSVCSAARQSIVYPSRRIAGSRIGITGASCLR